MTDRNPKNDAEILNVSSVVCFNFKCLDVEAEMEFDLRVWSLV